MQNIEFSEKITISRGTVIETHSRFCALKTPGQVGIYIKPSVRGIGRFQNTTTLEKQDVQQTHKLLLVIIGTLSLLTIHATAITSVATTPLSQKSKITSSCVLHVSSFYIITMFYPNPLINGWHHLYLCKCSTITWQTPEHFLHQFLAAHSINRPLGQ